MISNLVSATEILKRELREKAHYANFFLFACIRKIRAIRVKVFSASPRLCGKKVFQ